MRKLFLILAFGAVFVACTPKLYIVHTNDTHSHLDPVRGGKNDGKGGIIERAAFVDGIRAAKGEDKVLLLHAGDFNQGSSYYSEKGGSIEVEMVNAMAYDCIALGNHEFDDGIESLTRRVAKINSHVLCANCDFSSFELGKYVKPYAVVERGGMKIGVIGVTSDLSTNVSNTISSRIPQLDNVEEINRWSSHLRNEENCSLVILLSHLGYDIDQQTIPFTHGIDLVVGGHTHTFVEDFVWVRDADGKKVPIITDGCFGVEMGVVTVR